jgi:hypothetical protein
MTGLKPRFQQLFLGAFLLIFPSSVHARKAKVYKPVPQTSYFEFREGSTLMFSQRKKRFLREGWDDGNQLLKLQTLDIKRGQDFQVNLLGEIQSLKDGSLGAQFLLSFNLSPEYAGVRKEFVSIFPSTEAMTNIGREGTYDLARLPLQIRSETNGFRVKTLQRILETSTGTFRHCLELASVEEEFIFAPYTGLVFWKNFGEEWTLSSISDRSGLFSAVDISTENAAGFSGMPIQEEDQYQIEVLAKIFCQRYRISFVRILALDVYPNNPYAVRCRFLAAQGGLVSPKRYQVEEKTFLRQDFAGKILWGESESPFRR